MASVTFDSVTRHYPGADRPALDTLDLAVADGEFMVLVGPSGCGKTTTLRMLAGLEPVDAGQIYIGDRNVTATDPGHRDIAMVFQNYALYPHMTVAQNMGFALKVAKTPKPRSAPGWPKPPSCWDWPSSWRASPRTSPAANANASRWAARSCAVRRFS